MAVDISSVTSGVIGGTGNLDKLMSVAKLYLQQEYTSQRITGDKYAEAYIAIMNQVLGQAIQFSIQEEQTNRQTELQLEQLKLQTAQIALIEEQTLTQKEQTKIQQGQLKLQAVELRLQEENIKIQQGQLKLQEVQTRLHEVEIKVQEGQLKLQEMELRLKEEQILLQKEQLKLQAQQVKSEAAKIVDVIDGVPVVGSIGGQKAVYGAQVKAFKDKSYQAAAELLTQTWTVQRTSDSGVAPNIDNGLFDNNVGAAVDALFKQVGIKSNPISDVGSMNARLDGETIVATGTVGIAGDLNSLHVIASHTNGNTTLVNTYMDESKNFTVIDSEAFASIPKGEFSVIASFTVHGQLRTLRTRLTKP